MSIFDDIGNWFKQSSLDNNIAASIPILGTYYNQAFKPPPPPPNPQEQQLQQLKAQLLQAQAPKPAPLSDGRIGGLSKNIHLPALSPEDAQRKAMIAQLNSIMNPAPVQQQAPVGNPALDEIIKQLGQNVNPAQVAIPQPKRYTYDELYDKYYGIVAGKFDPQQNDLLNEMDKRNNDFDSQSAAVSGVYGGASAVAGRGGGADFNQLQDDETARAQNYQDYTNNVYSDSASRMANEFSQLGIGDVANYAGPKQAEDLANQQAIGQNSSDSFQRYLAGMEAGADQYSGQMADSYAQGGQEQIGDLNFANQQFQDASNQQYNDLEGQQDNALEALIQEKLMGQDDQFYQWQLATAQNKQSASNAIFDRLLALGGLQNQITPPQAAQQTPMDLLNQQQKQMQIMQLYQEILGGGKSQQKPPDYTKGMLGATQYLGQTAPESANNLTGILNGLLQTQPFTEDKFIGADGTALGMNPNKAAQLALQEAQRLGLNPQDTTALVNAIRAVYGGLR